MRETRVGLAGKVGLVGTAAALAAAMALPTATLAQDEMAAEGAVRIVHAADAPNVDVYVDGSLAIEDLAFGDSTDYVPLPAGEYQVQVVPAGASLDEGPIVIDTPLPIEAEQMLTVVATGDVNDAITPQVEVDAPAPPADMAWIKVGHTSWDAPGVDITTDAGDIVIENLEFPNVTDYLPLPGGSYDLQVRVTGTDTVAIDLPELTLEDGVAYSAYAIGSIANESLTAIALVDADTRQANVRVAHLSPDAPEVDVFVDGAATLEAVPFGVISDYLPLDAGEYRIQVAPAGAGADASVIDATLAFDAGSWTTVAAAADVADITALVFEDVEPVPAEGVAQLRAYHASADAPRRVDIARDGSGRKKALVKKLAFGENTGFLERQPGEVDLAIRQPNKKKVLVDIPALELADGTVYSAFAATQPDGSIAVIANVDAQVEAS